VLARTEPRRAIRVALPRGWTLASVVCLVLVAALFLGVSAKNPPAFNRDEAAISYNAYSLSSTGKDEYGARTPMFIRSFDDWKSPLYVYLLAGVYRITGPSIMVARTFSAVLGLVAVLTLYVLALAISRRQWIAIAVTLLAGLGPWLFETTRVVFEVALMPLLLALLLLVVYRAGAGTWRLRHSIAIGLLLAAMAYTYQLGRVLAPLLALGLVLCWYRRWRQLAVVWLVFLAVAAAPIGIWSHNHPGALKARYNATTYITPGTSKPDVALQYLRHYADNLNLWAWVTKGDQDQSDHVRGDGSMFFVEALLALAGAAVVLLRRRSDAWWRFVLFGVVVSPVAASAAAGALDTRRMVLLALLFPLLAIPALQTIAALPAPKARALFAVLVILFGVEVVRWQVVYRQDGPKRLAQFDAYSPALIKTALRERGTLYAFRGDHAAYPQMLLDAAVMGNSPTVVLDYGERPPAGAHVLGMKGECPQCTPVLSRDETGIEAYVYHPAKPRVMRTNFQMTSPLRPVGSPIDFTVYVDNVGDDVANHIILTIKLPPSMHLTGRPFYDMGYGCKGSSTIVCNIGWFPGHKSAVVRYEVTVDRGGPQTMTATLATDKLDVNTARSGTAFTVDLTPPASTKLAPVTVPAVTGPRNAA
jgi:4-amino-4-deoxy-L-arabinose transferase-like glycosyltransferase